MDKLLLTAEDKVEENTESKLVLNLYTEKIPMMKNYSKGLLTCSVDIYDYILSFPQSIGNISIYSFKNSESKEFSEICLDSFKFYNKFVKNNDKNSLINFIRTNNIDTVVMPLLNINIGDSEYSAIIKYCIKENNVILMFTNNELPVLNDLLKLISEEMIYNIKYIEENFDSVLPDCGDI